MNHAEETIVVGFDGSDGARAALRFALAEARLRPARLRVVCAWNHPLSSYMGIAFEPPGPNLDPSTIERAATEAVDRALAELGGELEGIELEPFVTEGPPAQVLLDAAAGGALLVVGSRGHGGFSGLMLGSVSQQCVAHAPCPVVVVPGPGETER